MKKFLVSSGKMVISDPCYSIPTWCQGIINNVKNGVWVADVEKVQSWGERVSILFAHHEDNPYEGDSLLNGYGEELPFSFGVDSGQLGFFDHDHYRDDNSANDLPKYDFGDDYDIEIGDAWYRAVCNITLDTEQWGVLPFGVVSSSGYGDGTYSVFAVTNAQDEYVGFMVVFIGDDDDEEFDDDDE